MDIEKTLLMLDFSTDFSRQKTRALSRALVKTDFVTDLSRQKTRALSRALVKTDFVTDFSRQKTRALSRALENAYGKPQFSTTSRPPPAPHHNTAVLCFFETSACCESWYLSKSFTYMSGTAPTIAALAWMPLGITEPRAAVTPYIKGSDSKAK